MYSTALFCIHTKINIPQTCRGWYKRCKHLNIYLYIFSYIHSLDIALLYTYCRSAPFSDGLYVETFLIKTFR